MKKEWLGDICPKEPSTVATVEGAGYILCLPFYRDQVSSDVSMTSWVRKLPKADRHKVVSVRIIASIFNKVHTLVDVVHRVVGRGAMIVPSSLYLLDSFVIVA